jgi:hypothetical protein
MGSPLVTVRCTSCGRFLSAPAPTSPAPAWYACPSCARPVPVIAPHEPPPLFSWEVYPQLYPLGSPPRPFGPRLDRAVGALLVLVTVLLAIVAGALLWQGAAALTGPGRAIGGHVYDRGGNGSAATPVPGARVNVSGEGGFRSATVTDALGAFSVPDVPSGRIVLYVNATGFAPLEVQLFASAVYSSPAGNLTNLTLVPTPGGSGTVTTLIETSFPDLENFVATVWSGTAVLGAATAVAAVGTYQLLRRGRRAWGVGAGMGGVLAPAVLFELGLPDLFPTIAYLVIAPCALGIAATTVLALRLAAQAEPEPRE